jgi:hypothetical protein
MMIGPDAHELARMRAHERDAAIRESRWRFTYDLLRMRGRQESTARPGPPPPRGLRPSTEGPAR